MFVIQDLVALIQNAVSPPKPPFPERLADQRRPLKKIIWEGTLFKKKIISSRTLPIVDLIGLGADSVIKGRQIIGAIITFW